MNKTKLNLDALSVESFATGESGARGTVRGHIDGDDDPMPTPPVYIDGCTCAQSCPCPTAAYECATVRATAISCTWTFNASCG